MEEVAAFIVITVIVAVIAVNDHFNRVTREAIQARQEESSINFFTGGGHTISAQYEYKKEISILVDTNDEVIGVFNFVEKTNRIIRFQDIIGCELSENNMSAGGVGRAIVGGVIAGGVGAIVGANTRSSKVMDMKLIIYMNDVAKPMEAIKLIRETTRDSQDYKRASEFAENMIGTMKVIVAQNEKRV